MILHRTANIRSRILFPSTSSTAIPEGENYGVIGWKRESEGKGIKRLRLLDNNGFIGFFDSYNFPNLTINITGWHFPRRILNCSDQ